MKPLGVGFPYIAGLPELYASDAIDFIEIAPDTLCRQRSRDGGFTLDIIPELFDRARRACGTRPIVVHGVELSIGSAHGWNDAYLTMLDDFAALWPFVWHSEHLGFATIRGADGATLDVGVPLPLPATHEAAALVAQRAASIGARYDVPFLLENPAYYIADLPADPEIGDEMGLLEAIGDRSGCGVLLDLHNIYANAVNFGRDPFAAVDRAPLERVIELHVAGGSSCEGFYMDAHDGRVPELVWGLLAYTLRRAPNVKGVVFELLDEFVQRLGVDGIVAELRRLRMIWERCSTGARVWH